MSNQHRQAKAQAKAIAIAQAKSTSAVKMALITICSLNALAALMALML